MECLHVSFVPVPVPGNQHSDRVLLQCISAYSSAKVSGASPKVMATMLKMCADVAQAAGPARVTSANNESANCQQCNLSSDKCGVREV